MKGIRILPAVFSVVFVCCQADSGPSKLRLGFVNQASASINIADNVGNVEIVDIVDYKTCIDLEKTGPKKAVPGEEITYSFMVTNCGELPFLSGYKVFDPNFISQDPIWVADLYPGDVDEFDMTYLVTDDDCGELVNNAWAQGNPKLPDGTFAPYERDYATWTVIVDCPECGDGNVDEGEECDDSNDIAGDGCQDCQIECGLSVEKFCSVPLPPPSVDDCDGKALQLVFVFTGQSCASPLANPQEGKAECTDADGVALTEPVSIEWHGRGKNKISVSPSSGIGIGTEIVVAAPGKRHKKLPADSKFEIRNVYGEFAQYVRIHTSCSKPLALGDVFGSLMLVELTSKDGGTVRLPDPPPPLPELADECLVEAVQPGSCDDDKPRALVFRYTAQRCSDSNHDQGDKGTCSGSLHGDEPVDIIYTGKDPAKITVTPSTNVYIGQDVTIEATGRSDLHSNTKLEIRQGSSVLQALEIHTSCSQPLTAGDQFGSMLLEEFIPKGNVVVSENVVYTYRIANNGPSDVEAIVEDDKLGLLDGSVPIQAGETVELTEKALLLEPGTVTNIVTVTDADDPSCSAMDEVTVEVVEPPPPPFDCRNAKPIQTLSMIWDGPSGIDIVPEGGELIEGINYGDEVYLSVAGLGNDFDLNISGAVSGMSRFHVSCSDQEMNGPEDCGKAAGDGKANDPNLINSWIFEGMAGNGSLDCTP